MTKTRDRGHGIKIDVHGDSTYPNSAAAAVGDQVAEEGRAARDQGAVQEVRGQAAVVQVAAVRARAHSCTRRRCSRYN